jgi:hypothetical protein
LTTRRARQQDFNRSLLAAGFNQRIIAMNHAANECDQNEEVTLVEEVSDETLEISARIGRGCAAAYTVAMCTGGIECPF